MSKKIVYVGVDVDDKSFHVPPFCPPTVKWGATPVTIPLYGSTA